MLAGGTSDLKSHDGTVAAEFEELNAHAACMLDFSDKIRNFAPVVFMPRECLAPKGSSPGVHGSAAALRSPLQHVPADSQDVLDLLLAHIMVFCAQHTTEDGDPR